MPTSQKTRTLSDPLGNSIIPERDLKYVRSRNRIAAFSVVHKEFKSSKLSKAQLAKRLDMDPGQLSRILGAPGNWTLDTVSDLLWAISEKKIQVVPLPARSDTNNHYVKSQVSNTSETVLRSHEPKKYYPALLAQSNIVTCRND